MNAGAASYNYTLGPTGNRTRPPSRNGRTLNWNYDDIYRLTSETIANDPARTTAASSYGLDPVGNRTSETSSLPGINSGSWPATTPTISNPLGELRPQRQRHQNANGNSHTYDSQNHMISMTNGSTVINDL